MRGGMEKMPFCCDCGVVVVDDIVVMVVPALQNTSGVW